MDRGYIKRQLFNAIVAKGSSYVCRMRDKIEYEGKRSVRLGAFLSATERAAGFGFGGAG
jgi:hypothetical protein